MSTFVEYTEKHGIPHNGTFYIMQFTRVLPYKIANAQHAASRIIAIVILVAFLHHVCNKARCVVYVVFLFCYSNMQMFNCLSN